MQARASLLRPVGERAEVTQIELFFDLVFVFAVTQLSALLRAELDALGALHVLMLFAATWWVWVYTSWVTNWLDPQRRPVKILLLVLMALAMLLAAALPRAFGSRGIGFAAALVVLQLSRTFFMLWALRAHDPANYRNFQRIAVWLAASSILWLAGGAAPLYPRTLLWLAALGLDLVSPALGFRVPGLGRSETTEWTVDGRHLAERCAGFVLIALGESITVTGATFTDLHWNLTLFAVAAMGFCTAAALWWIYFDRAADSTAAAFAESDKRGSLARTAYTYVHGLLVAAIIMLAAGDFYLLDAPFAGITYGQESLLLAGPAAYLLGNGIFRRLVHPKFPRSHILGLALLAVLALVMTWLSLIVLAALILLALLCVIASSEYLFRRQART